MISSFYVINQGTENESHTSNNLSNKIHYQSRKTNQPEKRTKKKEKKTRNNHNRITMYEKATRKFPKNK